MLSKLKTKVKALLKVVIAFVYRLVNIYIPNFLKNNFEVTVKKGWKIAGWIIGSVLMLGVVINIQAFTTATFRARWWLMAFALCMPSIIGLFTAIEIKIKKDIANQIWHFAFLLLFPFVIITMTECLNNVFIYDMTHLGLFANYIVVLIFLFIVFAISGSIRYSIVIITPILYGLALAHSYLMNFRGTPFIPMDFLSITTAAGVANTYNFIPTYKETVGTLLFIFIMIIGIKVKTPKFNMITKVISRMFAATFCATILIIFYATNIFADMGVKPDFWKQIRGYHNYGFVFNFFCNTKYLYVSEPKGYDYEAVPGFVSNRLEVEKEEKEEPVERPVAPENAPNIICIMNESLSDLQVLGDFTTNEDYMPFLRGLTENTVKGNLYVPVVGAGTSNTEFEFLTGHTTAFLPSGSNAYMLYVDNPLASLTSTLEAQGYSSFAFHPYYATGWNRPSVYTNMGFDRFIALENLMDVKLMDQYQSNGNDSDYLQSLIEQYYPNSPNMLLRQYISDQFDYQELIKDYENRDKSVPYYAFNVTMQNHGGYSNGCINFNESIYTTSTSKAYNKVNKYLSLVKASDDAFKGLVEYFSNVKEPTIICMFGDHHPSIETEFISEIMGGANINDLTLEQEQNRHKTQFYIWANYDIEEKVIDKLSVNYLSSLLLKTAGLELTEYNKYMLSIAETLPVINTVGYIDAGGNYFGWNDESQYGELLDQYEKVQYNNIFDLEHKKTEIFYLEGYEYILPEEYSQELLYPPAQIQVPTQPQEKSDAATNNGTAGG